ncbi:MAG: dihydroneopterin aldolase [Muribaculaceae bacterium]|nr:dihydroneopterin aldolase [Muribaculaceae bacterium]
MMTPQFDISLRDVRFRARHGVFAQERTLGNDFIVNLSVSIPAPQTIPHPATPEMDLSDTISYADLYEIVRKEMNIPTPLLESVCLRIAAQITASFPIVTGGYVEITKIAPPISGIDGSCSVKYHF